MLTGGTVEGKAYEQRDMVEGSLAYLYIPPFVS